MKSRYLLGTVIAGLVTLVVTVGPAAADDFPAKSVDTEGAHATCDLETWQTNVHDDTAQLRCRLSDESADDHSVYVEWWQGGFPHEKLPNKHGCCTTIKVEDTKLNTDGSFDNAFFKVCRDIQAGPDNCSGERGWSIS